MTLWRVERSGRTGCRASTSSPSRARQHVDRPAVARAARDLRHPLARRARARHHPRRRRRRHGLLDRRCGLALARRGSARDLGDVPAGAPRGAMGLVPPSAGARAGAVHRAAVAARDPGAASERPRVDRARTARRVGERARERSAGSAPRGAPRRVRARAEPGPVVAAERRARRPRAARGSRHPLRARGHGPLLPPAPRRPAVRGTGHGVALGGAGREHDVLLRARRAHDPDRPASAAAA